jgi:hypothetical protein
MKYLAVIRHGAVDDNLPDPPITEDARRKLAVIAWQVRIFLPEGELAVILHSPLNRAFTTALEIFDRLSGAGSGVQMDQSDLLAGEFDDPNWLIYLFDLVSKYRDCHMLVLVGHDSMTSIFPAAYFNQVVGGNMEPIDLRVGQGIMIDIDNRFWVPLT